MNRAPPAAPSSSYHLTSKPGSSCRTNFPTRAASDPSFNGEANVDCRFEDRSFNLQSRICRTIRIIRFPLQTSRDRVYTYAAWMENPEGDCLPMFSTGVNVDVA